MQDGNAPPTGTAVPNTGESTLCAHPLTSTRGALYLIDEQTPERARAQGHSQRAMIAPHAMIVTGHTIAAGHAAITHVTVREMWPLSHPNPTAQAPASVAMRHLPAPHTAARHRSPPIQQSQQAQRWLPNRSCVHGHAELQCQNQGWFWH
jgi:hypothetical protein